ncbi:hypothetical protein ACG04R_00665 [Roseateles sp. BYS78W]|uniref:Uncharacterized protein n=1 Tax=Pelomonas candidula TaxID=3299025 RepID=A0ABW7H5H3_9BURK
MDQSAIAMTGIELPFTSAALRTVLGWGLNPDASPHSHWQIAQWCDAFWCLYLDADAPSDIERLLPILADVDCQWDLFLANSYSLEELRTLDLEQVLLPLAWFDDWLHQVASAG